MLNMKSECEHCHSQLELAGKAFICSYECTFCDDCYRALEGTCPNCGGELLRRPRREAPA